MKSFSKPLIAALIGAVLTTSLTTGVASAATVKQISASSINLFAKAGDTVRAKLATYSAKPSKVTQQWYLNGVAIANAKTTSYKIPTKTTVGKLQFKQTSFFGSASKVSASNILEIGKLYVKVLPSITFTDGSNTTLQLAMPIIQPAPVSTTSTWVRNGFALKTDGAATRTLELSDRGNSISARVTAKAPAGYRDASVDSNSIAIAAVARTYVQGWSDEFNGSNGATVDTSKWAAENGDGAAFGNRGWGNSERQWYRFENATTDGNGVLNILASRTSPDPKTCYYGTACEWYSAKLVTKNKVAFKYGRIEARIKGAPGLGTWGAFWTLGDDIDTVFWPMCGEIDVTELVGSRPSDVLGYLHGPLSGGPGRGATKGLGTAWANDFHTYAVDWLPDQVIWYVDGVKYAAVDKTDRDWVFDHPFYLILNLAMGGNLGGTIDANLSSTTMSVDYVRWSTINGIGTITTY